MVNKQCQEASGVCLVHSEETSSACLPKIEEVFEGILYKQAGYNPHGGWQAGSTHALALERALINTRGHDQGRDAGEAGCVTGNDNLCIILQICGTATPSLLQDSDQMHGV